MPTVGGSRSAAGGLDALLAVAREIAALDEHAALVELAACAVVRVAPAAGAGAIALAVHTDGEMAVTGCGDLPGRDRWSTGPGGLAGGASLRRGRVWRPTAHAAQGVLLPAGWPVPVLGVPLQRGGSLRGALYAFHAAGAALPDEQVDHLVALGSYVAIALERADLTREAEQAQQRLARMMAITADIARRLDFETIAQHIVEGLTAVTDFGCAAVTLREGELCRRLAASGLADPRIGLVTDYAQWEQLLRPEWRRGETAYLIPPEAPSGWSDVPDLPRTSADPATWTARHGLVVVLRDPNGETVGFLSVDEPRSRRLPDEGTLESLELFARQVEVALVNARMYSTLRRVAERDALTGLRNRGTCWRDLEPLVAAADDEAPVVVAVLDVDDFKALNDRHGHATGDQVLRHVADRLRRSVRETDRVYRIGGEEFVIALPGTSGTEAAAVLDRARRAVTRRRAALPGVTVSLGYAQAPGDGASLDELYKAADRALYAAKRAGKNRVVAFDSRTAPAHGGAPGAGPPEEATAIADGDGAQRR